MNIDELKLVFNALKQCNSFAFAGGLGLLRATAHRDALAILEKALAQPEQDIATLVEGMEVSIDVSTGEHDSGHRLFGVVTLVQENQKSKHGLILLVQEPEANFKEVLAQRTWVGLFDEEIEVLFQTAAGPDEEVHIRFARAIESKLKEVNT